MSFSDLNLKITNLSPKSIDQLVEHAIKLGYDKLALSVDYEFPSPGGGRKSEQTEQQSKPDSANKATKKQDARPKVEFPAPVEYKLPAKLETRLRNVGRSITIYTRINIKIKQSDINNYLHHLKSKPVQIYDLIAVEPTDNQVFMYLCTNNFSVDIISVNSGIECGLTDKHLVRPIKSAITSFSVTFEINYSSAISSSIERRDLIMLGRALSFNTKSKGLIINSGTSQKINLRGPYEILNLAKIFDISEQEAHQIARSNPHVLLDNSFCRKHTSAGMVYFNDLNDLKKLQKILQENKRKLASENTEESTKNPMQIDEPKKQDEEDNLKKKKIKN